MSDKASAIAVIVFLVGNIPEIALSYEVGAGKYNPEN